MRMLATLSLIAAGTVGLLAQGSAPAFEVASVRENTSALVLARKDGTLGPQLRRTDGNCDRPQACTLVVSKQNFTARTQPIDKIAGPLQSLAGRPVVDRTGLTGTFDIDMKFSYSGDDGPTIFTALQEQLGLKLEPSKGPFKVVVIDKVARPTPD